MAKRTLWIEGATKRYIRDLRVGDRVDLEGDPIADPGNDGLYDHGTDFNDGDPIYHPFAYEFEVVADIERETDECTRVDFESGFSCGFPPDHLVDVDGEQDEDHGGP